MNEIEMRLANAEALLKNIKRSLHSLNKNYFKGLSDFYALKEFVISDRDSDEDRKAAIETISKLERAWAERFYLDVGDVDPESADKLDSRDPEADDQH